LDGGEITNFALLFCGTGEIVDFSINSQVNDLASCQNEQSTVILTLGASFTDAVTLAAATESGAINADDFNFSFDAPSRQLTANFTDWSGLAPGNYNLTLTVSEGDTERDIMLPLRINPFADPAVLTSPEDGAMLEIGEVVFNWDLANNANNYTLQYSFTEDFATIEFEQISIRSILTLDNLPTGRPLYWRIISNDNCGNAISAVRSVTVGPTSIQDFGQGRILSVYPNPVKQFVSVQATGNWSGNTEARLFNTRGQLLSQYTLTGSGSYQWDLGVLPAGVYYLRFEGLGVRHTERLVVLP
ncbi:MAG: T9SS type A sorting domain-containing protein, partial [Bacteroidota bacterium]